MASEQALTPQYHPVRHQARRPAIAFLSDLTPKLRAVVTAGIPAVLQVSGVRVKHAAPSRVDTFGKAFGTKIANHGRTTHTELPCNLSVGDTLVVQRTY